MIKKYLKLSTKSVSFLLRRKKIFHGRYYSFWYYPFYSKHHRISFHVSKKVHKSATKRNLIKRSALRFLLHEFNFYKSFGKGFYQVFVRINRKHLDDWQTLVANKPQKDISTVVHRWFIHDWNKFVQFLTRDT